MAVDVSRIRCQSCLAIGQVSVVGDSMNVAVKLHENNLVHQESRLQRTVLIACNSLMDLHLKYIGR